MTSKVYPDDKLRIVVHFHPIFEDSKFVPCKTKLNLCIVYALEHIESENKFNFLLK